jgi:serine O-acetyltransferase
MHASVVFRFGNWIHRSIPNRFVRLPFSILYAIMEKLCIFCWGIWIHPAAEIGPGFYIGHFGGIIVGPVKMGYDCNISQQVTIGMRVDGQPGVPSFGDRVWIGAGSVIYGDIEIGSGVSIAPLTLVSRSLPDRVMVAGNPLRVLAKDYDNSQSIYGCPDEDRKAPASDPCDIPPCASTTGGLDSSAP